MYCPKCGSQNADEVLPWVWCGPEQCVCGYSKHAGRSPPSRQPKRLPLLLRQEESNHYSRCGIRGASSEPQSQSEKQVELSSAGWRGLIGGFGFLIVAGLSFGISESLAVLGLFMLIFASVFLAGGISRFIQARGIKKLRASEAYDPALTPGQQDCIQTTRRLFETHDLTAYPPSVTEHPTTHLR